MSEEVGCWKIIADPVAPDLAHVVVLELQQVLSVEQDLARFHATGSGDQAHDRQAGHALAAAGLADEAHDLAAVDVEVDPVTGADDAVSRVERGPQALDLEERSLRRVLGAAGVLEARTRFLDDRCPSRLRPRTAALAVSRRSSVEPRIEGVAQPVAEQVEAEHAQGDGQAREEDQMGSARRTGSGRGAIIEPHSAAGGSAPRPTNDSAATSRIGAADAERALHDERGQGVGQDAAGAGCPADDSPSARDAVDEVLPRGRTRTEARMTRA
ncbi:MAG: hypothetical protein WKF78_01985 [Candidatus Limnocylindrales bacterium]